MKSFELFYIALVSSGLIVVFGNPTGRLASFKSKFSKKKIKLKKIIFRFSGDICVERLEFEMNFSNFRSRA